MKKYLLAGTLLSLLATSIPVQAALREEAPSLFIATASALPFAETKISFSDADSRDDIGVLAMTLLCGDTSDCFIDNLKVQTFLDEDGDTDGDLNFRRGRDNGMPVSELIEGVTLIDNETGNVVGETTVSASGLIQFADDFVIEAGYTVVLTMYVDLTDHAYYSDNDDSIAFAIPSAYYVRAEDELGNLIRPTGSANRELGLYLTVTE